MSSSRGRGKTTRWTVEESRALESDEDVAQPSEPLRSQARQTEMEDVMRQIGEMELVLARFQRTNPPTVIGGEGALMSSQSADEVERKAEATSCFESADEAKRERRSDVVWRFSRWFIGDDVIDDIIQSQESADEVERKAEATSCFESADEAKRERRSDVVWRFSRWFIGDDVIDDIIQSQESAEENQSQATVHPVATQRYSVEDFQTLYLMNQSQATAQSSRELICISCCYASSRCEIQSLEEKKQAK
ncbi:transcription factor DIVARICATA [Dorcoceras hygrometricum]|uniref:Transcription factor DIVARICATA n=1 Tax=Dorcoceras hygrometricum TaxID=472368 RepID=A0A2Z7CEM7_9LAMI|nr:transcription factor DIVARICATA [Dorcoceras hygrometricum]